MMEELTPFEWKGDQIEDSHSEIYNELLKLGYSQMTEEQALEYGKMTGAFEIEKDIEELKKLREIFRKEVMSEINDGSLEGFVRDAYPFEMLFIMRY